jgi:signal-transduction protein with cAMP-binding, CBS, and nucleotidyltransferase domain
MHERGHGSLGVVDGMKLLGLITERDLVRAMANGADLDQSTVSSFMSRDPDIFSPEFDVWEAAEWLAESGYRHLPVVEDGTLLGIISIRDLLLALVNDDDDEDDDQDEDDDEEEDDDDDGDDDDEEGEDPDDDGEGLDLSV